MKDHPFIFSSGHWLGEGKIQLSMVDEELSFFTRWKIPSKNEAGAIECIQEVQVKGLSEIMLNHFHFFDLTSGKFSIELENQALGRIRGSGLINDKVVAWEFKIPSIGFEGFEFYEKGENETYTMRAEYATTDQFRTVIHGKIWKAMEKQ